MPSLAELRAKTAANPNSVSNGGNPAPPTITPENLVQIPSAAPLDLPVPMPQRGVFPPNLVMVSDRSDSTRVFRGPNTRSAVFQTPALPNATAVAKAVSSATSIAAAVEILVNNQKTANQAILNFLNSATVQFVAGANGQISAIAAAAVGDGLTHGRSIWPGDPGVFELWDDFTHIQATSSTGLPVANIGQLGWVLDGTVTSVHGGTVGGIPPYLGQFYWDNNGTLNDYGILHLGSNGIAGGNTGTSCGWALFDNPGSLFTFVFKIGGNSPGNSVVPNFGKKNIYIGLMGVEEIQNTVNNPSGRPETFFGLRYDTSAAAASTSTGYACTAVTQSGNNMAITGTFTGANQTLGTSWIGRWFTTTGFGTVANNGCFICTAATPTLLTLTNPNGVTATGQTATATGNTPLVLTAAANGNGTQVVYTGTITGGGTNNYVGQEFYVSGFGNAGNNGGPWLCTANSTTTITLANPVATGSAETHAGYTSGPNLLDTTFVLEAVQNPTYGTNAGGRNNTQGQTLNTGVAPVIGTWHRLDIYISTTGSITMTLDGSTANTLVATVSKQTITIGGGGLDGSVADHQLELSWSAITGSVASAPWVAGSQVVVSGFSGVQAGFNNGGSPWTVLMNNGGALYIDYPAAQTVALAGISGVITGYPGVFPGMIYGNTQEGSPISGSMTLWVDYFSCVWNPALSATDETPIITNPRYF